MNEEERKHAENQLFLGLALLIGAIALGFWLRSRAENAVDVKPKADPPPKNLGGRPKGSTGKLKLAKKVTETKVEVPKPTGSPKTPEGAAVGNA